MGSCLSRPSARSELSPQPNPFDVSLRSVQSVPQSSVHGSSTAARLPLVQPLSIQLMMVHLNTVQDKWFLIGIALGISVSILHTIEQSYPQGGVDRYGWLRWYSTGWTLTLQLVGRDWSELWNSLISSYWRQLLSRNTYGNSHLVSACGVYSQWLRV